MSAEAANLVVDAGVSGSMVPAAQAGVKTSPIEYVSELKASSDANGDAPEPEYAEHTYWEERYRQQDGFFYDWYQDYASCLPLRDLTHRAAYLAISSDDDKTGTSSRTLKRPADAQLHSAKQAAQSTSTASPSFLATAPSFEDLSALELEAVRSARILVIGCGNSLMPEQMAVEGWVNVVACDFAPSVITQMDKRRLGLPQELRDRLRYKVVDARCMREAFANSSFDVVLDKGTLDAVMCGDHNITNAISMLSECSRVLKDDGVFQCLTYGRPISRSDILKLRRFQWDLAVDIVSPEKLYPVPSQSPNDDQQEDTPEDLDLHYAYTCRKRPAKAPFRPTLQDIEDEEWAGS